VATIVTTPRTGSPQVAFDHMRAEGRDIRKTVIAEGVYQFMTMRDSYVRQLNSIVIVNDSDVLVFDTNTRPSSARLILAEIRKITPKPVRYVVNSHGHPDHWSGNQVYAEAFPSLEIIATRQTRDFMLRMADVWAPRFTKELEGRKAAFAAETSSGKRADGSTLTPEQREQDSTDVVDYATFTDESQKLKRIMPTIAFDDTVSFFRGGREFRFIGVTGDAEGTTVLYLPAEKILITGDAVSYPIPYISAKPAAQAASLRKLAELDVTTIIPGHGPAFHDKHFMNLELNLLDTVIERVAKARASGVQSLEEMQRIVTLDDLRESLAHGDPDLESRFRSRVRDLVAFIMAN
jgi:glyoxylase-like metal-dependent hydrolase (beta-lactamase superfamily II)